MRLYALATLLMYVRADSLRHSVDPECSSEQCVMTSFLQTRSQAVTGDVLEGSITIKGTRYRAICNCNPYGTDANFEMQGPICNVNQVKVQSDSVGGSISAKDVRENWADASKIAFSTISKSPAYCMDSRVSTPQIFTLGGDLGEFLLGLHVYESRFKGGKTVDKDMIKGWMSQFVSKLPASRQFVHCTDISATDNLAAQVGGQFSLLDDPPYEFQEKILNALSGARMHGDIHLRQMISRPSDYSVRANLVLDTIRAFFELIWEDVNGASTDSVSSKLKLVTLMGDNKPDVFLEVSATDECTLADLSAVLQPKGKDKSAYISNITAMEPRRRQLAAFLAEKVEEQDSSAIEVIANGMNNVALNWMEHTGKAVAGQLPIFRISLV